jgi:hypothetical protein
LILSIVLVVASLSSSFSMNWTASCGGTKKDGRQTQGVLKPAHAATRLRDQHFELGDRVITVAETGSVEGKTTDRPPRVVPPMNWTSKTTSTNCDWTPTTTPLADKGTLPVSATVMTSDRLLISLLVQMLQLPRRYRLALGGPQLVEPPEDDVDKLRLDTDDDALGRQGHASRLGDSDDAVSESLTSSSWEVPPSEAGPSSFLRRGRRAIVCLSRYSRRQ